MKFNFNNSATPKKSKPNILEQESSSVYSRQLEVEDTEIKQEKVKKPSPRHIPEGVNLPSFDAGIEIPEGTVPDMPIAEPKPKANPFKVALKGLGWIVGGLALFIVAIVVVGTIKGGQGTQTAEVPADSVQAVNSIATNVAEAEKQGVPTGSAGIKEELASSKPTTSTSSGLSLVKSQADVAFENKLLGFTVKYSGNLYVTDRQDTALRTLSTLGVTDSFNVSKIKASSPVPLVSFGLDDKDQTQITLILFSGGNTLAAYQSILGTDFKIMGSQSQNTVKESYSLDTLKTDYLTMYGTTKTRTMPSGGTLVALATSANPDKLKDQVGVMRSIVASVITVKR